jgi:hypothetical protein
MNAIAKRVALRFGALKERHTTEYIAGLLDVSPDALEGAMYVQERTGNWYWKAPGERWQTHDTSGKQSKQLHDKAVRVGKGLVVFKKKPAKP